MKKFLSMLLALSMCAALCVCVSAAESGEEAPDAGREAGPIRMWGKVTPWDGEGILLVNEDDSVMNEAVIHLGDAPVVDAAAGLPLDTDTIKEGDILYAWIGPAATMSLPPQVSAIAVVGNVPDGAAVPEYCEIAGAAVVPAPGGDGAARFPTVGGGTLEVTSKTEYTPWLTRQIVRMEDLTPGARVMVWKDGETAEKVLVFPYAYQGWVGMNAAGNGDVLACVNGTFDGETPQCQGMRTADGTPLLPIRAIAEAAGYDVRWDKELGAVVSLNGETVLSAKPGANVIVTPEGETGVSSPCVIEAGVTYLPAADLAYWLNLFLTTAA